MKKLRPLLIIALLIIVAISVLIFIRVYFSTLTADHPSLAENASIVYENDRFAIESEYYDYVHQDASTECKNPSSSLLFLLDKQMKKRTLIKDDLCLYSDPVNGTDIIQIGDATYVFFPYGGGDAYYWDVIKYENNSGKFTNNSTVELERELAERWGEKFDPNVWMYLQSPSVDATTEKVYFELVGYDSRSSMKELSLGKVEYDLAANRFLVGEINNPEFSSFSETVIP